MDLLSEQSQSNNPPKVMPDNKQIILVGGEYFFCEKIAIPEEISQKKLNSFLEMNLEGMSPFPLDQLYWGYVQDKKDKSLLLYAMYTERLSLDERVELLDDAVDYVFPSFIVGFGQKFNERTITFINVDQSFSALFWEVGSTIPSRVETVVLGESPESARKELLSFFETANYSIQPGYWKLEKFQVLSNRSARFESQYHFGEESGANYILNLPEKDGTAWNADIRPRLLMHEKHKREKTGRILWIALVSAIIAFGLFAILEVVNILGKGYLIEKKDYFKSQEQKVKLIENQESLVQKIEHLGHAYYLPLKMLELLNNYRPKNIYFTAVVLDDENKVEIEGVAQSVDDLNQYTDDLNDSDLIEQFEVGQVLSRQGKVTFKMDVTFKTQKEISEEVAKEPSV